MNKTSRFPSRFIHLPTLLLGLVLAACSTAKHPSDPIEPFNRAVFAFNETVDRSVVKPVARGYDKVVPSPLKRMVSNFFSNLDDVLVTFNDLLQFKFRQAASDGSRVIFNSTFGLLGLFEVTTRLEKHHEDFGQTLRYWGVPSGPYIVLPIFGPSTITDTAGLVVDTYAGVIRQNIDDVSTRNTLYIVNGISTRANMLDSEKVLDNALDRYSFLRDAYLMRRINLTHDGNPPRPNYEEFDEEE